MMTPQAAWSLLGLQPCDDVRAVKSAYAAKLKAIDPDSDIDAFQQLRLALRVAQQDAAWRADSREEHSEEQDATEDAQGGFGEEMFTAANAMGNERLQVGEPLTDGDAATENTTTENTGRDSAYDRAPAEEDARWATEIDTAEQHSQNIRHQLFNTPDGQLDEAALYGAVQALLHDPRMENIGFAEQVEEWLASTVVQTIPRSDSIIPFLVQYFHWDHELAAVNARRMPYLAALRGEDLRCIASLQKPTHKWHRAFRLLSRPGNVKLSWSDQIGQVKAVRELLASLRYHNPAVEQHFDPETLGRWESAIANADGGKRMEGAYWVLGLCTAALSFQIVTRWLESLG